MENNRASFGSNFGFLMAAIGSAVGLGNIWGFPVQDGYERRLRLLLVYLVLAVLVGLAVMIGELTIGRKTGLSPVAAYRKLSKKFTWMGYMGSSGTVPGPLLLLRPRRHGHALRSRLPDRYLRLEHLERC